MNQPDPLKAFFDAGDAPAVDRDFRTSVMQRIAQRRLQLGLARAALAGLAVFVGLLVLRPVFLVLIVDLSASLQEVSLVLAGIGLAAFAGYSLVTGMVDLPGLAGRSMDRIWRGTGFPFFAR